MIRIMKRLIPSSIRPIHFTQTLTKQQRHTITTILPEITITGAIPSHHSISHIRNSEVRKTTITPTATEIKNTKARWEYTDSAAIRSYFEDAVILGTYDSTYINFIRIPYGEGHFYIHNNPRVFTNFYLIDAHKLDYAEKALGHLREGTIYFDDFSTVNYRNNNSGYGFSDSPLQFILSQQSLRWAWYLLLILALLYLLFRAKRKQRVIPVLEPNTNTSLEFTKTIGNLYYQQKDHSKLAQQKMKLFLAHVRMHYRIPTHEINEQLIRQIRLKSELPEKSDKRYL